VNDTLRKDFEEKFQAIIVPGERRFYRRQYISYQSLYDLNVQAEDIPSITIHMPLEEFERLNRCLIETMLEEKNIRDQVPALQKAWDRYQLLLKMCRGDYK